MAQGDHLIVRHATYTHHAIDLEDGFVVHYGRGLHDKSQARVEKVPREIFTRGKPVTTGFHPARFSPDQIIQRALSRLGENEYDLLDNNCEHFVNWCRLGVSESAQIQHAESFFRRGGAAAAKAAFPRVTHRLAEKISIGRVTSKAITRCGFTAALAGDAVQLSVEAIAIRRGTGADKTQRLGQQSGALASGGVGFMLGGPTGAAVGIGSWCFGEWVGQRATKKLRQTIQNNPSD